ncbi:hypothetical protein [uncultured Desulfobacter sp.]|uniref:hypothetical protein n=1 Tax=uncultured Desulfobacter sp. TaxID=240139 RepID=UPI002AAB38AB|nr:hypothetical protein [uncultured Desulfobacter sp.]
MEILKHTRSHAGKALSAWLFVALMLEFVSCTPALTPTKTVSMDPKAIPVTLAVLPVRFLKIEKDVAGDFPIDAESEKGEFVGNLTRGVIQNQLAGKGYRMRLMPQVDQMLGSEPWQDIAPSALCDKLGVDGLVYPEIITSTMVLSVAYDLFKIEARIKMVNRLGTEVGAWEESASKRKVSLPTSVVGLTATVVGAFIDEPARKQMRLVIYDWGYRVSQPVPDNPHSKSLPEIRSVDSNIDRGVFAVGDAVKITVKAENDLSGTFDIGQFKKRLPLSVVGEGTYQGIYVVQPGDQSTGQPVTIRLVRPNGVERIWIEAGSTVSIDGVPPPTPEKLTAQTGQDGVHLTWNLPQGEALKEFVVEKSSTAVGDFKVIASSQQLEWLDNTVAQGETCYYRVAAVDLAGNRSAQGRTLSVTVPFFEEVPLKETLSGNLVPGVYRLSSEGHVLAGHTFSIGPGTTLIIEGNNRIVVDGILKIAGSSEHPVIFSGQDWKGFEISDRGEAQIAHAVIKGCAPCIENSGNTRLEMVSIKGAKGDGLVLKGSGVMSLEQVDVTDCERGVIISGGKGIIEKSVLRNNAIGLDIIDGEVAIANSSLYDNTQGELRTVRKIVLENNYLGAAAATDLKLEGDVLVKSLLDAPYPHGRRVVLVDDTEITPGERARMFLEHKQKGVDAFGNHRFGDARQELTAALMLKKDPEAILYLAYTQNRLGENAQMAGTLEQGIQDFPYEVRLYQLYIKHLAAKGEKEKAGALLEKALKMNPDDQNLMFLKDYLKATQ